MHAISHLITDSTPSSSENTGRLGKPQSYNPFVSVVEDNMADEVEVTDIEVFLKTKWHIYTSLPENLKNSLPIHLLNKCHGSFMQQFAFFVFSSINPMRACRIH